MNITLCHCCTEAAIYDWNPENYARDFVVAVLSTELLRISTPR
jgi:hypothetical protein